MRIDDTSTASADLRSLQIDRTSETGVEQPQKSRGARDTGDSANVSPLGLEISRAIGEDGPAELRRVAEAQGAHEAGLSKEDASSIAESLIGSALDETALEASLIALFAGGEA